MSITALLCDHVTSCHGYYNVVILYMYLYFYNVLLVPLVIKSYNLLNIEVFFLAIHILISCTRSSLINIPAPLMVVGVGPDQTEDSLSCSVAKERF